MDWGLIAQNILAVPLFIVTIFSAIKNWNNLWDNRLTNSDKRLLMRIALIVFTPFVVFLHECGHAAATLAFGGTVREFHFGFFFGNVVSSGSFSDWQSLWITLSGNLVQVACGLVALLIAIFSTSPPIVALCVYVALSAISGTLVVYAGLSFFGLYGDWIHIYTSPLKSAVFIVGTTHLILVVLLIWAVFSERTTLWFARKTNPSMIEAEREILELVRNKGSVEVLLQAGWFYYLQQLPRVAKKYVHKVEELQANNPENQLLSGYVDLSTGNAQVAFNQFLQSLKNDNSTNMQKVRGYLGAAMARTLEIEKALRGESGTYEQWKEPIELYECAIEVQPTLGDAKFYRAELFSRVHLYNQAIRDLSDAIKNEFLDQTLATKAATMLEKLTATVAEKQ